MAENHEIVLKLEREDRATVFDDPKERLQVAAYDKAFGLLLAARDFAYQLVKKQAPDQPHVQALDRPLDRIHNTIFIDGARGSGKTAFMLNLKKFWQESHHQSEHKGLYFSQPIDPTLLNVKEDFINVIIGQVHAEIEVVSDSQHRPIEDDYIDALEKVTDALASEFTAKSDASFGVDRMLAFKGSLELERRLFDYFAEAKKLLDCQAIVLLIDDVDMSLDKAFNVLEVIRKYLACPFVLAVVSGDKKLYHTIVTRHFVRQLAINDKAPQAHEITEAKELAQRYIQKIFPEYAEIQLQTFVQILYQYPITVKFHQQSIAFNRLYARLQLVVFAGCNHMQNDYLEFLPRTSRDLAQFLSTLMSLSRHPSEPLKWLLDSDKLIAEWHRFLPLLHKLTDYFAASGQPVLQQMLKTSTLMFEFRQSEMQSVLFFRHLGIIDVTNHYATSPEHRFAEKSTTALEKSNYSDKDLTGQLGYMARLPELMVAFSAVEPYTRRLMIAKHRVSQINNNDEQLLLHLYCHNDYYSSYQTGYLIFFGKLFELVMSSLYQPLKADDIERLLAQAPFHGFFHYFPNKLAEIQTDIAEVDENADEEPTTADNKLQLEAFADQINAWRSTLNDVKYSGQLLYGVFVKYFGAVKLLKNQRFIAEQSIADLHQRVKLILLNTIASLENNAADVVKQGIAMGAVFNLDNIQKRDQSYLKNIKPLLEPHINSLTKAISKHPVFKLKGLENFNIKDATVIESDVDAAEQTNQANQTKQAKQSKAKPKKASDDKSYIAQRARAALAKVVSKTELENLAKVSVENEQESRTFVYSIVERISNSDEMAQYREEYKRQIPLTRSFFHAIYQAASIVGFDDELDYWLRGKE